MFRLTRRTFLAATLGGVAAGAGAASGPGAGPAATALPSAPVGFRFFSPTEARFVSAACACLIPADWAGGGALEAGVPRYIDAQLAGDWGGGRRLFRNGPWQPGTPAGVGVPGRPPADLFRAALDGILGGLDWDFAAASPAAQARYLRRLEAGAVRLDGVNSSDFFATLLAMTVEGFFSHPRLGLTRDRVSWRMRGFPGACANLA